MPKRGSGFRFASPSPRRKPGSRATGAHSPWMPAFAGMTMIELSARSKIHSYIERDRDALAGAVEGVHPVLHPAREHDHGAGLGVDLELRAEGLAGELHPVDTHARVEELDDAVARIAGRALAEAD